MLILGIDSSSSACSVAITRDGSVLASEHASMTRGHAAALPPMISMILSIAEMTARDLDAIAVSTGPGSFTGLRVGMAAAKGLALSLDRPLVGISCFDAVARRATHAVDQPNFDVLLVALASKREEIFIQGLDNRGVETIPGQALTPLDVDERLGLMMKESDLLYLAGESAPNLAETFQRIGSRCRAEVTIGPVSPSDAADIAILGHETLDENPNSTRFYESGLTPIYMRPPSAVAPRR